MLRWNLDAEAMAEAISGQIGTSAYANLKTHMDIHEKCPDLDKLIADPMNTPLVEEPPIMFALCSALSMRANDKNMGSILQYVQRQKHMSQIFCAAGRLYAPLSILMILMNL